jgi:anthranilate synthase component 1
MTTEPAPSTAAQKTRLMTLVRELPADLDTPVSVYLRLKGNGPSFLLESVTGGEQVARYSFIGIQPKQAYVLQGRDLSTHHQGKIYREALPADLNPLDGLREKLIQFEHTPDPDLPRFSGGLVGYLGYDLIRFVEPTVPQAPHPDLPDAIFLHADTLVAFDHAFGRLLLITNEPVNGSREAATEAANARLDMLESQITAALPPRTPPPGSPEDTNLTSNLSPDAFKQAVKIAKEHINDGDIFQVVLSQRFSRQTTADSFSIYRALRRLNPSPYMFYFDFEHLAGDEPFQLIGASPEMHVRLEGRKAALRPIAGTRPRGETHSQDLELEKDLLGDPKERAEHVMLIDLARNDLGRVCEFNSIHVPEKMVVERYSHVMHIVSHTEGRLRDAYDAFDLMNATFPAGTVSGAPKIRAMQIIHDLENEPRGPYAGAVGYFAYDGNADTCIALRTMVMRGQTIQIQAGAGIVADSDPQSEFQETINKARALEVAVQRAEAGHTYRQEK